MTCRLGSISDSNRHIIPVSVDRNADQLEPTRFENYSLADAADKKRADRGRSVLRVRSRLRNRRIPGSKPNPTEDLSCKGLLHVKSYVVAKRPPMWSGSLERSASSSVFKCRPRRLTAVQNYEIRPKIALVLLQNGTLI
ncbi:hypothetical protein AVEN_118687-1 [Araneus ventricosus]|uniref:Uncharacterized protein n=1 Tax=Araneus ventricosus TaxID=182803 RepID=A0A4Y2AW79_ARAVE|nr:hypothetical protein AVEN_118687-1 [Araneus ventricosus]